MFVRPNPIALSEFIPGIDVGVTGPMLARLLELELEIGPEPPLAPIGDLSASASGTRASRERRRSVLLDGDVCWPDDDNDVLGVTLCGATDAGFGLDVGAGPVCWTLGSSRETTLSVFSSAADDMDDCGLARVLGAEVGVVEETEFEAA
jgi:hypothetical protein